MSATSRKRKEELAEALRKLILSKGKTPALKYQQLFEDIRGQSDTVSVYICVSNVSQNKISSSINTSSRNTQLKL